jgi:NAD(P)-dependent dehydrogenase (short-subunit alcohol dehydrogenase family)
MSSLSLHGKSAVVTGGTAGIGFYTALDLARLGARVVVTARNETRGRDAVAQLRAMAGHSDVELLIADASSVCANARLAEALTQRLSRLDILVNNAGGGAFADRAETKEGFEAVLALNFIGPFTLTTRLLPVLSRSGSPRIVNVVSSSFRMWTRDPFDDLQSRERYIFIDAHARAKLLNLLFTLALARKLAGKALVNAVNPGMAWTPGVAALTRPAVPQWRFVWPIVRWVQRRASAETAARAPLFLASSPDLADRSGRYFDGLKEQSVPAHVRDTSQQDRVWEVGESFVTRALDAHTPRT